jgi:hypothetical protein
MNDTLHFRHQVSRCALALQQYGADDPALNLIDLLADAMHWCDANGQEFHLLYAVANCQYVRDLLQGQER